MRIITTIIALLLAVANINAQEKMKENVDFNVWPKGELNTAYAKYFIGNSYLAPLDADNGGPVNVTFEPRCRNNWHIHHKSVQVLICVAGHGWYVEEGKEPVALHPGVVVAIPAEAKHWHGAAKDSWMQHLTYMTKVEEGASNEWLEPVTDAEYDKLDAEYIGRFEAFAYGEVVEQVKTQLDDRTRYICYLATLLGCQGIDEYRELLPEALDKGVTPVEVKEIVYQATAYLGMGPMKFCPAVATPSLWLRNRPPQWKPVVRLALRRKSVVLATGCLTSGSRGQRIAGTSTNGWPTTALATIIPAQVLI